MRKKLCRQIISILLIFVMVIGMLSNTTLIAYAYTMITEVSITAPEPVVGQYPCYDMDKFVTEGEYYIDNIEWSFYDDHQHRMVINDDEKFEEGVEYTVRINIVPEIGCSFTALNDSTPRTLLINGQAAYLSYSTVRTDDDIAGYMALEYTFPALEIPKTEITSIEFYHEYDIVAGGYWKNLPISNINGNEVQDIAYAAHTWYRHDQNFNDISVASEWTYDMNDSQFEYGKAYALKIKWLPNIEGHKYSNNVTVNLRTPSGIFTGTPDGNGAYLFFFDVITNKPVLDTVKITMSNYGLGLSLGNLTFASTAPIVTSGTYGDNLGVYTIKKKNGNEFDTISATTNFDTNLDYYLAYYLKTTSEYDLSGLTPDKVYVNNIPAISRTATANGIMYLFELPKLLNEAVPITSIELKMPKEYPVAGEGFYFPTIESINGDENLAADAEAVNASFWYEGEIYNKEGYFEKVKDLTFSDGKAYKFQLRVNMKYGNYQIQDNCTVTLKTPSGETIVGELNYRLSTAIIYDYYFNLGAPTEYPKLKSYHANISGYEAGADVLSLFLNAKLNGETVNKGLVYGDAFIITYGEEFKFENMLFEGKLEYDKQYFCVLPVQTQGVALTKDMVSLNGLVPDQLLNIDEDVYYVIFKLPVLKKDVECNGLEHEFESVLHKASFDTDGKTYELCSKGCGEIRNIVEIAKVSTVELSTTTYTYDGKIKQPTLIIKDSQGKTLKENQDYYVTFPNESTNVGIYTCEVVLKGNYTGSKKIDYTITPKDVKPSIKLSDASYVYNGKVRKPTVTVNDGKEILAATDYIITYSKGCKNVGKYKVTVTLKGNYTGTATAEYVINPKPTSLNKLTTGKKKLTVTWKKLTSQTTGYEIQYSTSSKFKSAKKVTVTKNKTTKTVIKKLKSKKKYYIRIRTYKTVKVDGKNTKFYSSWSKAKSIKIK